MSRSPKYSFAQLGQQVHERLRREQSARRKRRADAVERERDRAFARARAAALERQRELAGRATAPDVRQTLADALSAIDRATTAAALAAADGMLDGAERQIGRHRAEVTQRGRPDPDRVAVLAAELAGFGPGRLALDPVGAAVVETGLARLRAPVPPGPAAVDEVEATVRQHLERAIARRSEHDRKRREAVARVGELAARLTALTDDAREARVRVRDGERAADALDVLRGQIAAGEVADVLRLCARLEQRLDASEAALDAAIDQITQRRAILGSLIKALPDVGFAVDRASLTENADGAIAVRAVRAGGDTMAVVVEPRESDHRVLYNSDRLRREQRQGRGEAACAQLVEVIDALQASAVHDGVVLSTVSWEGQDRPAAPGVVVRRQSAEEVKQQKGQPWAR
ncbi:hypothetical protein ACQPZX_32845 [Actinoplanes sp. CA-142083]|uniref:hypothetical protein n=1 Tax=Actinoplanes sp. CA-142083 TaxID=3239903 RepID=UPI003D92EB64